MASTTQAFGSTALRGDGKRQKLHPSEVKGRFISARRVLFVLLLGVYVAAPLVKLGGHPAVHLDVSGRRFFLFGATFNAQDFWLVLLLVTVALFALVFVTAWLGRVWCGWACPQTVFLEGLYRPIERFFEGPGERRRKNAQKPLRGELLFRRIGKHAAYVIVSLALSQVALSLFLSARDLTAMVFEGPFAHPVAFSWSMAVTFALYFNFAWFREQLCLVVCPYGRLQSAMQDRDSLIVGYDALRGDPRARLFKAAAERSAGDCVDCNRCVQVCPTGIDIRNGLQMECIGCAQCIDACDAVMEKVGLAKGLIRYDSQNGLDRKPRRVLRGRLIAYGALLTVATVALVVSLAVRTPFEANLLRAPGVPWISDGDSVRNQFDLHLVNKNGAASTFRIEVQGPPAATIVLAQHELTLEPLQGIHVPLFISANKAGFLPGAVNVTVEDSSSASKRQLTATLLGPTTAR